MLYVAEVGALTYNEIKKANAPTRCIFENGTELQLLLQSLASNLYKGGKRVTVPDDETLTEMGLQPNTPMASVYVLRSLSDDPQVTELPGLHKIGSTSSTAVERTVHAASETTFLGRLCRSSRSIASRAASRARSRGYCTDCSRPRGSTHGLSVMA